MSCPECGEAADQVSVDEMQCYKCGHRWKLDWKVISHGEKGKCPECGEAADQVSVDEMQCYKCGHRWKLDWKVISYGGKGKCPNCKRIDSIIVYMAVDPNTKKTLYNGNISIKVLCLQCGLQWKIERAKELERQIG
jgi:uncharacterized protein (UPF0212 family)